MADSAYDAALRILLRRPHSERELTTKLTRKEYSEDDIALTLERLKQEKLIDDMRVARELTDWHVRYKPLGKIAMRQRLMLRGFSGAPMDAALASITPDVEREMLTRLAGQRSERQVRLEVAPAKRREQLARYLLSRGFNSESVLIVINALDVEPAPAESID